MFLDSVFASFYPSPGAAWSYSGLWSSSLPALNSPSVSGWESKGGGGGGGRASGSCDGGSASCEFLKKESVKEGKIPGLGFVRRPVHPKPPLPEIRLSESKSEHKHWLDLPSFRSGCCKAQYGGS